MSYWQPVDPVFDKARGLPELIVRSYGVVAQGLADVVFALACIWFRLKSELA